MQKLSLLVLMLFILGCTRETPSTYPDWHLIYSHDKQGEALEGDKAALIRHINAGRPVRIVWRIRDDFAHMMDAGFLTEMQGEVLAQTRGIVRQIPDFEAPARIALDAEEQSHWHAIFSTTGEVRSFQTVERELHDIRFPLAWYIFTAEP